MTKNKRGYYVSSIHYGVAVVATSTKEAKQIAHKSGVLLEDMESVEWIGIRVRWIRDADVNDLPIGIVNDARRGLLCGIYSHLEEARCDECGKESTVFLYKGLVLCGECVLKHHNVPDKLKTLIKVTSEWT